MLIYPSRIGFRFSEPYFTRTLDLSQSQNPRLSIAKPLVLFNRKNQNFKQSPALKFLKPLRNGYIYGWDVRDDGFATDILLVMGGSAGISALKKFGIKIGKEYTKKVVAKHVKKEMVKQLNQLVSRKIITKAAEKKIVNSTKLVPLVGAPIGGTLNYFETLYVGRTALKFHQR